MTHPLDQHEPRAGNELGGPPATARVDQAVLAAVQHERRDGHLAQGLGPRAARRDPHDLAGHARRIEGSDRTPRRRTSTAPPRRRGRGCPRCVDPRGGWRWRTLGRSPVVRTAEPAPRREGCPTSSSPVVDITEVMERRRSGCSMARVCTIMPPIDRPITWARSTPSASSTATTSAAMSESVYGTSAGSPFIRAATTPITSGATSEKWVDRPTSRLSMRTTWKPSVREALAPLRAVVDALATESVDEEEGRLGRVAEGLVEDLRRTRCSRTP